MKNSKNQPSSPRETSTSKIQKYTQPTNSGLPWFERDQTDDAMVLRDGPAVVPKERHQFDLEERTAQFGEAIVRFTRTIQRHPTNDRLINQLVGCGTSVGANYCEASEGVSK